MTNTDRRSEQIKRLLRIYLSFFAAVLFVALLAGVARPMQKDFIHTMGTLMVKGGVPFYPGHLEAGSELFDRYTIFFTGTAAPPVAGDIKVEFVGPAPTRYSVYSRYPPVVPLKWLHDWYGFEDATLKGVNPGDKITIGVVTEPPAVLGEYEVTFTNVKTGQVYLKLPVTFSQPRAEAETAPTQGPAEEPCH